MNIFTSGDFLIPKTKDLYKWSVIACDQFTSDADYWRQVEQKVGAEPSTLRLVLPEIYLNGDYSGRIADINATMQKYLQDGIFQEYVDSYVYVERTLLNGDIRRGVVGVVDLENYDVAPDTKTAIRPTERTVLERIPPRKKIREKAALELSHILLLCDDTEDLLLGYLESNKDKLPLLYDFDLMQGGGHLRGYLVQGEMAKKFAARITRYETKCRERDDNALLYAVGDGNHSLCTAKACYEAEKAGGGKNLRSRYAMVELENIQDTSQKFEPIHRIVQGTNSTSLLATLSEVQGLRIEGQESLVRVESADPSVLAVGVLQEFLDNYLATHGGKIDYIHDDAALMELAKAPNSVGFLLPPIDKNAFFNSIVVGGVLPRKTFSMGHGQEKRYYLEARRIKD